MIGSGLHRKRKMKRSILFIMCILLIIGCTKWKLEKKDLCNSTLCNQYYDVWKNIFLSSNNMSEEYFKKHVFPYHTEIATWNSGESFRKSYQIKIDWFICTLSDQFIVKTSETTYPALTITRGDYLTESEIIQVLSAYAFSSSMNVVESDEHLKYSSYKKAVNDICCDHDKITSASKIRYFEKKPVFTPNGHPYLIFGGIHDQQENKCFEGKLDLITGECDVSDCNCVIY